METATRNKSCNNIESFLVYFPSKPLQKLVIACFLAVCEYILFIIFIFVGKILAGDTPAKKRSMYIQSFSVCFLLVDFQVFPYSYIKQSRKPDRKLNIFRGNFIHSASVLKCPSIGHITKASR